MYENDWGFRYQGLGPMVPLGNFVLFIPRDFWFEAVLGTDFGGLAVLLVALGWCPST